MDREAWSAAVHGFAKNQTRLSDWSELRLLEGFPGGSVAKESSCNAEDMGQSLGQEDPQEKEMATHPSILAWKSPWTKEPGGLQSMGSEETETT